MFTCRSLDGGGTRLSPCDIAVATPQRLHHGLPIRPPTFQGVPRLRDEGDGCASPPAQIHQVRAGASLRGVKRRFLAYAFPPRSPHPRRLAVPTRHGFVRAACHPSRHLPRQAAPSFTAPLRRDGGEGLSPPTQSTSASRRTGGETHVMAARAGHLGTTNYGNATRCRRASISSAIRCSWEDRLLGSILSTSEPTIQATSRSDSVVGCVRPRTRPKDQ